MSNPLRKTMVYLGLADEEVEYEQAHTAAAPVVAAAAPQRASVTPLRRPAARPAPVGDLNEILTVHPRAYKEAPAIAEAFREGVPVIMNLTEMDDTDAKRIVDFAAGLVFGCHGTIERVTNKVFLLSPANVDVGAEARAQIAQDGFFNQS